MARTLYDLNQISPILEKEFSELGLDQDRDFLFRLEFIYITAKRTAQASTQTVAEWKR